MPHKINHARRHKFEKVKYRVTNWRDYEAALRRRGNVTLWISEAAISGWVTGPGARGIYSDLAVETSLALRLVFELALRQTEGFVGSVLKLLDLDLPVPDQTTLSRRGQGLKLAERRVPRAGALDIIVDSTGLRIHGPGEWLGARHGGGHRRQWRKLHLGLEFDLLPNDEAFLGDYGLLWETIVDGDQWILIHGFPTPEGYDHRKVVAAIRLVTGYPKAALDMVYFHPQLSRVDGKAIGATSGTQNIDGKPFQQWSRHRTKQNPWQVGQDSLGTHICLVEDWLEREFEK